jgi:hypothetical protein
MRFWPAAAFPVNTAISEGFLQRLNAIVEVFRCVNNFLDSFLYGFIFALAKTPIFRLVRFHAFLLLHMLSTKFEAL